MIEIKVSVVIAVYNAAAYLRQAMESILGQTLKEIEVICIDDNSTDNSIGILQEYAVSDARIRILHQKEVSAGAGAARNLGLSYAQGEYLSVLDADDFFEKDMLEKAYEKAVQTKADIVLFDAYLYDDRLKQDCTVNWILSTNHLPKEDVFSPQENAKNIFQMTLGAAWNGVFSRSFIEREKIKFECIHHADDLGFVYLAFACAGKIAVIRERLIHYRRNNEGSQSANINRWPETGYLATYKLKKLLEKRNIYQCFSTSFVRKALAYALFYLGEMRDSKSFHCLYFALQNEYLGKLGTFEVNENSLEPLLIENRDAISRYSPTEYLLRKYQKRQSGNVEKILERYDDIIKGSLAIYGAGENGRKVFCDLIQKRQYAVTAWVDRNYKYLGYPVQSPEVLKKGNFSLLLVAIESEFIYQQISQYLMAIGIPENKIVWVP